MPGDEKFDFTHEIRTVEAVGALGGGLAIVVAAAFAVQRTGNQWIWAALVPALLLLVWFGRRVRPQYVKRAVLGGGRLRAITADGREHVFDVDDIEIDDRDNENPLRRGQWQIHSTALVYPGGFLRVRQPAGKELVDQLRAAKVDR